MAAIAFATLCLVLPARAAEKYDGIHTVAILSALGDVYFTDDKTPFNAVRDWILEIPDWKIDDAATAKIAKLLYPRFTVKEVAFHRYAFAQHQRSHAILSMFGDSEETVVKQLVLQLPRDNGVDAYIVVRPCWFKGDYISMSGLAVARQWNDERAVIYTSYVIEVVDAKTGEILSRSVSHVGEGSFFDEEKPARGGRLGKHWAPDREHFTAEHAANVMGAILFLLDYSLPHTLYGVQMSALPDDEDHGISWMSYGAPSPAPVPVPGALPK